ncbi:hypothetical protein [Mesorhizobium sp. 43Arga]
MSKVVAAVGPDFRLQLAAIMDDAEHGALGAENGATTRTVVVGRAPGHESFMTFANGSRLGECLVDEDSPYREAYRLERVADGNVTTIATFYSAKEALTIMPSLKESYRLMLGDKQIWPNQAPMGRARV